MNVNNYMQENEKLFNHMFKLTDPKVWSHNRELIKQSLEEFMDSADFKEIKSIFLVGHGSSYAMSLIIESYIRHIAKVNTMALPAFRFANYSGDYLCSSENTLVVGVSCSGNTESVLSSLKAASEAGAKTLIISGESDSEGSKLAQYRIKTDVDSEQIIDATVYTISCLHLMAAGYELALSLGIKNGSIGEAERDYWDEQLDTVVRMHNNLPDIFERMRMVSTAFDPEKYPNYCVLGTGPNYGTSIEGALKICEMCWMFGAGEELEDFAHGRFREVDEHTPLFILAPKGASCEKTMDILAGCARTGTPTIIFTDAPTAAMRKLSTIIFDMPKIENEYLTPFLYVWPLWFYGYQLMEAKCGPIGGIRYGLYSKDINYKANYDEKGNKK